MQRMEPWTDITQFFQLKLIIQNLSVIFHFNQFNATFFVCIFRTRKSQGLKVIVFNSDTIHDNKIPLKGEVHPLIDC